MLNTCFSMYLVITVDVSEWLSLIMAKIQLLQSTGLVCIMWVKRKSIQSVDGYFRTLLIGEQSIYHTSQSRYTLSVPPLLRVARFYALRTIFNRTFVDVFIRPSYLYVCKCATYLQVKLSSVYHLSSLTCRNFALRATQAGCGQIPSIKRSVRDAYIYV